MHHEPKKALYYFHLLFYDRQQKIRGSAENKNIEHDKGKEHKGKLFASYVIFHAF